MTLLTNKKIPAFAGMGIAFIFLFFFIFIPAFKGEIFISPALQLGIFSLRWYGLIMAAGILIAYLVCRKNAWKFGISKNDVDDYAFWSVIAGLIGARIFFVLFNWEYFSQNPSEIYKIWHGGLAIYGAILLGLVFTYFYSRKKAYSFEHLADLVALGLPLGQAVGRLGNFINQEAYGTVTDLPWKMFVRATGKFHHPAFLYESLWDLLVFLVLFKLIGKAKSGTLALSYLLLYSFGRFFIEAIRTDSLMFYGFRVSQAVAFLLFVICGFFLLKKQRQS